MKIVVISNPDNIKNEQYYITQLFEQGLQYFHLRKPNFPRYLLEEFIAEIPEKYHDRIILHSHYNLCLHYNFKGIHLTRKYKKKPVKTWFKILWLKVRRRKSLHVSMSSHTLKEAIKKSNKYEYVFLSPIFKSISKENYKSKFSEIEIQDKLTQYDHNVIALGGIDLDKITITQKMGFKGVALLGSIWRSPDPVTAFIDIKNHILGKQSHLKVASKSA